MAKEVDRMKALSGAAYQVPKSIEERHVAAEDTLGILRNSIGAPGTYDLPGTTPPAIPPTSGNPVTGTGQTPVPDGKMTRDGLIFSKKGQVKQYDKLIKKGWTREEAMKEIGGGVQDSTVASMFTLQNTQGPGGGLGAQSGDDSKNPIQTYKLDPAKAANQLQQSSAFRQVSRMMAESEQMLARTGPLYEEMIRNTQLPIIESSAAAQRDNVENLRRAIGRGGAARKDAFEAIQKMRQQDQLNMERGKALAESHMKLDLWARDNAKNVINFADSWSANQAGIRDSFNQAMDNAAELMSTSALPFMFGAQQQAQAYRDANSAASRGKINRWISAVNSFMNQGLIAYSGRDPNVSTQATSATGSVTVDGPNGPITNTASVTGNIGGEAASAGGDTGSAMSAIGTVASLFSSRDFKTDFSTMDDETVLQNLMTIPVEKWQYKWEPGVEHMGVIAEDFQKAFGVGDGKTIQLVDIMGVLTASVRALEKRTRK